MEERALKFDQTLRVVRKPLASKWVWQNKIVRVGGDNKQPQEGSSGDNGGMNNSEIIINSRGSGTYSGSGNNKEIADNRSKMIGIRKGEASRGQTFVNHIAGLNFSPLVQSVETDHHVDMNGGAELKKKRLTEWDDKPTSISQDCVILGRHFFIIGGGL